jgi:hypothetical protein
LNEYGVFPFVVLLDEDDFGVFMVKRRNEDEGKIEWVNG